MLAGAGLAGRTDGPMDGSDDGLVDGWMDSLLITVIKITIARLDCETFAVAVTFGLGVAVGAAALWSLQFRLTIKRAGHPGGVRSLRS